MFVTVGSELPFDRLVGAVDRWAGRNGRGGEVFAQIGRGGRQPINISSAETLPSQTFHQVFQAADLVVAHAGMGTILTALEARRPLVVVPRRADLGEHRNDHQAATVARLSGRRLINAAADEVELVAFLQGDIELMAIEGIPPAADESLIEALRRAIGGAG